VLTVLGAVNALNAQIVINEFSCANKNIIADNFGEFEDWIELYNAGTAPVDLTGYYLSDTKNNPTKWPIPSGVLNPGAFSIFFASALMWQPAGTSYS
jgi:hypothetical protein